MKIIPEHLAAACPQTPSTGIGKEACKSIWFG